MTASQPSTPGQSGSPSRSQSPAVEDYLEQIYNLIEQKGYARVVDIAENLGLSQPSVTNMIQRLDSEGYVVYEKYRGLTLTEEGRKVGKAITKRHESLSRLLRHFGIDEATIYQDVEGMEHYVSRPTLAVIEALCGALDEDPALLKKLRRRVEKADR